VRSLRNYRDRRFTTRVSRVVFTKADRLKGL
jgi:hypothetical protein